MQARCTELRLTAFVSHLKSWSWKICPWALVAAVLLLRHIVSHAANWQAAEPPLLDSQRSWCSCPPLLVAVPRATQYRSLRKKIVPLWHVVVDVHGSPCQGRAAGSLTQAWQTETRANRSRNYLGIHIIYQRRMYYPCIVKHRVLSFVYSRPRDAGCSLNCQLSSQYVGRKGGAVCARNVFELH